MGNFVTKSLDYYETSEVLFNNSLCLTQFIESNHERFDLFCVSTVKRTKLLYNSASLRLTEPSGPYLSRALGARLQNF